MTPYKLITVILIILAFCCTPLSSKQKAKPAQSVEKIRADRDKNAAAITSTTGKIKDNDQKINRQLKQLSDLNAEISSTQSQLQTLRARHDSLTAASTSGHDSITMLQAQLRQMRQQYIRALRNMQASRSLTHTWAYILNADNYRQAYNRIRYINQYNHYRNRRAKEISQVDNRLKIRQQHLDSLEILTRQNLEQIDAQQQHLDRASRQADKTLASLRANDANLRATLARQKKRAKALDNELDRLIAEQQRLEQERRKQQQQQKQPSTSTTVAKTDKPAQPSDNISDDFAANKGHLPFPVASPYQITKPFGRHPHPTLPKVETDNSGIDIEVKTGTPVQTIFNGTVSAIFRQEGFGAIVMVRHGNYITIYAGLDNISVSQDQKVAKGQTIGKVNADINASTGCGTLHFEIRKERQKLDPTQWVSTK